MNKNKFEVKSVHIADDDHIWINGGRQFVSLTRLLEIQSELIGEVELLQHKIEELTEQNEAYKTLLGCKLKDNA